MKWFLILTFLPRLAVAETLVLGSKADTEGHVLGEVIAQVIEATGEVAVERKLGLGNTGIIYTALKSNEIDLYLEYTGTISQVILKNPQLTTVSQLNTALADEGLEIVANFGFNNTYAVAVTQETAKRRKLRRLSDLRHHPDISIGFSYEFMKRPDGYRALLKTYEIPSLTRATAMEHGLKYEAVAKGKLEAIEVYSTDSKIKKFNLIVLEDDRKFFPIYQAVILARSEVATRAPKTWHALKKLEQSLTEAEVVALNSRADIDKAEFTTIAADYLRSQGYQPPDQTPSHSKMWTRTLEHFILVMLPLLLASLTGIPLGFIAQRMPRLGQLVLAVTGLLQTIPSLALLCFFIPFMGIGTLPSMAALFLYGLLPIVRNTYSGLLGIDGKLLEVSCALGMTPWQQIRHVQLPLASFSIMAGIRTSAIINIGTATLAALIGAGGYGTYITTGLALNDIPIILSGAIPAAVMALVAHGAFDLADRFVIPAGLRLRTAK